ncbi:MAG: FAD-dependent oxidoreductase [Parcubacteria group bacterium]
MENIYDLIILGGGPAGVTAGIYARRRNLKTLLITKDFGGQVASKAVVIENYPGFLEIQSVELIKKLIEQLKSFGAEILLDLAKEVKKEKEVFSILTESGKKFSGLSVIVASGSEKKMLNVPGEKDLVGKGVSYCSVCDGPFFAGKKIAIVGGGNAGVESAIALSKTVEKIYILEYGEKLLADERNQELIAKEKNVEILTNAAVKEITGDKFVNGLRYEDKKKKEIKNLEVEGVFIEIGYKPASNFVKELVSLNERGEIIIDFGSSQTNIPGLFAAGDVTSLEYKQIVVAAGEGAKAALSASKYIKSRIK